MLELLVKDLLVAKVLMAELLAQTVLAVEVALAVRLKILWVQMAVLAVRHWCLLLVALPFTMLAVAVGEVDSLAHKV